MRVRPVLTGRLGRLWSGCRRSRSATAPPPCSSCAPPSCSARAAATTGPPTRPRPVRRLQPGRHPRQRPRRAARRPPRRRRVLVLGVGLFGLAYAGFAVGPTSVLALAPWFVAAGWPSAVSRQPSTPPSPPWPQPTCAGRRSGCWPPCKLGNLAASTIAGMLWTIVSPRVAFAYLAAWMVVALVGLLAAGHRPWTTSGQGE